MPDIPLITFNSTWKYLDDGSDQGTAWRGPTFDDTVWASGAAQLGFGEGDEATPLRHGRRRHNQHHLLFPQEVRFGRRSRISSLTMRLLRDDAGVVYVNNNEVFRSPNLPAAPTTINHTTPATTTGENSIDTAVLSGTNIVAGQNVVAVEIHQESITSSDVSFDLELTAKAAQSLEINVANFNGDHLLYWTDPTARVEATDALAPNASWTPVEGSSPLTIPTGGSNAKFYRLAR